MGQGSNKKFNPERFRTLMEANLKKNGFDSILMFAKKNGFHRNSLARAMTGAARPTLTNLNKWCSALNCTPQERADIITSIYAAEAIDPLPSVRIPAA